MRKRPWLWGLALAAFVAGFVALQMYHKPHKDYAGADVERAWEAEALVAWFQTNDASTHGAWSEKVVSVTGEVREFTSDGVILEPGVVCVWEEGTLVPSLDGQVTLKGRIVGFDDLFGEVRVDHAQRLP